MRIDGIKAISRGFSMANSLKIVASLSIHSILHKDEKFVRTIKGKNRSVIIAPFNSCLVAISHW